MSTANSLHAQRWSMFGFGLVNCYKIMISFIFKQQKSISFSNDNTEHVSICANTTRFGLAKGPSSGKKLLKIAKHLRVTRQI